VEPENCPHECIALKTLEGIEKRPIKHSYHTNNGKAAND